MISVVGEGGGGALWFMVCSEGEIIKLAQENLQTNVTFHSV